MISRIAEEEREANPSAFSQLLSVKRLLKFFLQQTLDTYVTEPIHFSIESTLLATIGMHNSTIELLSFCAILTATTGFPMLSAYLISSIDIPFELAGRLEQTTTDAY